MHDSEDVAAAGQLTFGSPAEFDAWSSDFFAARAAKIDHEAERVWIAAEAQKPESEESKQSPGIVALADRRRDLEEIPESERTPAQQWELDSLDDVKLYEEVFPRFFEGRRKVLRSYERGTADRRLIRKPSRVPYPPQGQRRPREHRGSSRVARARPPSASDDPHEQPKPGNRANVVWCDDEILVLFVEQHSDRVSVKCGYCHKRKRGSRLTLLGDFNDHAGWWRSHDCDPFALVAVAA